MKIHGGLLSGIRRTVDQTLANQQLVTLAALAIATLLNLLKNFSVPDWPLAKGQISWGLPTVVENRFRERYFG